MADATRYAERLRKLPMVVQWTASALLVVVSFVAWLSVFGASADLPFVLFLPAVMLSSVLFDRGSGFVATAVGVVIVAYVFVEVRAGAPIRASNLVALLIAFGVGAALSVMTEASRRAYLECERSRAETEAARLRAEEARENGVVLLRECRHRVSNDLQRVIAMMRLQEARTPEAKPALRDAAARIQTLAKVHDRLARQSGLALVDAREFIHELVADFQQSLAELRAIGWFVEAESHLLSFDRLGAVGLIAYELLTNCVKHAFPADAPEGAITVSFRRSEPDYVLCVEDDGVGDGGTAPAGQRAGIGMQIVKALAAQLGGHLEMRQSSSGTSQTLVFPVVPRRDALQA
jgi:two-component system, sensor histidine kinase PdtaS